MTRLISGHFLILFRNAAIYFHQGNAYTLHHGNVHTFHQGNVHTSRQGRVYTPHHDNVNTLHQGNVHILHQGNAHTLHQGNALTRIALLVYHHAARQQRVISAALYSNTFRYSAAIRGDTPQPVSGASGTQESQAFQSH